MAAQAADRFAVLESRMLASNGPAIEHSIGFRPPSNPPSNSALEQSHLSPSPSLAAAAHTGGGMESPKEGGATKRKLNPDDSLGAHSVGASPDKRGKAGPSPAKAKAKAAAPRAPSPSARAAQSPDAVAPSASTPSTSRIDSFFAPKIAAASASTAKGAPSADRPAATSAAAPSRAAKPPARAGSPDAPAPAQHETQAALDEMRQSAAATQRQLSQVQAELEQARLEAEAATAAMNGMKQEISALRTSTVEERGRQGTGREALREARALALPPSASPSPTP